MLLTTSRKSLPVVPPGFALEYRKSVVLEVVHHLCEVLGTIYVAQLIPKVMVDKLSAFAVFLETVNLFVELGFSKFHVDGRPTTRISIDSDVEKKILGNGHAVVAQLGNTDTCLAFTVTVGASSDTEDIVGRRFEVHPAAIFLAAF